VEHVIRFRDSPPQVEVVTSGPADAAGFRAFIEAMFVDPRYRPGIAILLDHSELDMRPLSPGDVRAVADFVAEHDAEIGAGPCAAVQPTTLGFGFARMRELYNDGKVSLRLRVFRERDEALAWLVSEAPETRPGPTG